MPDPGTEGFFGVSGLSQECDRAVDLIFWGFKSIHHKDAEKPPHRWENFMRIDTQLNLNQTVDKVNMSADSSVKGGELSEVFHMDAGTTTMNSSVAAKSGVLAGMGGDGSAEAVAQNAQTLRDNLTAMETKMDLGRVVALDEEGVDVNEMTPEEIVTVVEQIQIKLATWCDDYTPVGLDVSASDIEAVNGQSASASRVLGALKSAGMEPTAEEEQAAGEAFDIYLDTGLPTEEMKAYLLKNELEPSIRNLYVAEHSSAGMCVTNPLSETDWQELRPQVGEMLSSLGVAADEGSVERARFLLEHELEINERMVTGLEQLDQLTAKEPELVADRLAATMIEGRDPMDTLVTGQTLPWEETLAAMQTLREAEPEHIMTWISREYRSLDALSDIELLDRRTPVEPENADYQTAKRQVEEARLLMTLSAGRTMEKAGISINTLEISELVDRLREQEAQLLGARELTVSDTEDGTAYAGVSVGELNKINEVLLAYEELKSAPHVVLGSTLLSGEEATAESLTREAAVLTQKLSRADEAYEALRTEIRPDLGDSLRKAVSGSTQDILSGLGYENNEANRRAVSILAYHHMEMTEDNLTAIKAMDSSVNRLFRELTPERTLQLIRNGIDPMTTEVNTLTGYLEGEEAGSPEKYSEFLYRLEQQQDISEEEREQYLGVYRLIHQFDTDGMNALGGLLATGSDLTMANMLSAQISAKDRGSTLTVSDEMEDITVRNQISYYRNLFHELEPLVTPEKLSAAWGEDGGTSPEAFAETILSAPENKGEDPVPLKQEQELLEVVQTGEDVLRFVSAYELEATLSNLKTAGELLHPERSGLKGDRAASEKLKEAFGDRETLNEAYEELESEAEEVLSDHYLSQESYDDLETLRMRARTFGLMTQLAHRDCYYVPYETESGEQGIMNVRILSNTDTPGRFSVKLSTEELGSVTMEGVIEGDELRLALMSDSADGIDVLRERVDDLQAQYEAMGLRAQIEVSHIKAQPTISSGVDPQTETGRLYEAAAILVRGVV